MFYVMAAGICSHGQSEGELLIPSLVKGNVSKPVFGPDAATLGKLKLGQPQNRQEGVQGILDIFKPKKKQP